MPFAYALAAMSGAVVTSVLARLLGAHGALPRLARGMLGGAGTVLIVAMLRLFDSAGSDNPRRVSPSAQEMAAL